jgi:hypothetical protein
VHLLQTLKKNGVSLCFQAQNSIVSGGSTWGPTRRFADISEFLVQEFDGAGGNWEVADKSMSGQTKSEDEPKPVPVF